MAGGSFRLEDVLRVVDQVSGNAQFPLADAAALEAALGGADATVALGAEQHTAAEVQQIPADYFPIACKEDLFTKLASLRSSNGDQPSDISTAKGRQQPAPAGAKAPARPRPASIPPGRNVPAAIPPQP